MSRTKEANIVSIDVTDRLRDALNRLRANELGPAEVDAMGADVRLCAERLARVRARGDAFAGIEFSEDMQKLLKLVGKKRERMRFPLLGKAAAL